MDDGTTRLLIKNLLNRYLINSPLLPHLQKNPDDSLTIYLQKNSPGQGREANWLPAPHGPIYLVMRLYWPQTGAAIHPPPRRGRLPAAGGKTGEVNYNRLKAVA
jgi:hypothetical protein